MDSILKHTDGWGYQPGKGALDTFLSELEVLLRKHYETAWEVHWEHEDGWIDLKLQIPSDANEEGEGN